MSGIADMIAMQQLMGRMTGSQPKRDPFSVYNAPVTMQAPEEPGRTTMMRPGGGGPGMGEQMAQDPMAKNMLQGMNVSPEDITKLMAGGGGGMNSPTSMSGLVQQQMMKAILGI